MKFFQTIGLYSVSGILLGVGFLFPHLWLLGIIGAALQIKIMLKSTAGLVWGSYLAWWIKFLFVLGFYWTIYPIKWLPFEFGSGELWLVGLYWVTVSLFVGTSGLVFGLLFKLIKGVLETTSRLGYLLLPIIWVVAEIAGSYLLSVFTLGPGSLINGYFSLGYLGLLLGEHDFLVHLANFGGVYVLSFASVMLAYWFSQFNRSIKRSLLIVPMVIVFLLLLSDYIGLPNTQKKGPTTSVAVISTSFPVEELFNRDSIPSLLEEQEKALALAVSTNASYIITPEDARFFNQTDGGQIAKNYFAFKYPNSETIIIDSSRVNTNEQAVLQGFLFDSKTLNHLEIHKRYLVPQGEFIPYFYAKLFRTLGFGYLIDDLEKILSYRIGPKTSQSDLPDNYPSVLFCFESSSATGVRTLIKERPYVPFVAHPVSHTWFNEPKSLWSQLETSLKVQAIWNNIAIVSATNHGPSQLFLPNGVIKEPREIGSGEHWSVGLFSVPIR